MPFKSLFFKNIINTAAGIIVAAAGFWAMWVVISLTDLPPVEIRGAIAVKSVIAPNEDLIVRELLVKRRHCPSVWAVNITRRSDNRLVHNYEHKGGFAPITAPNSVEAVLYPIHLPPNLPEGDYVVRLQAKYESCGSWTRSSWFVVVPDVFFTVDKRARI